MTKLTDVERLMLANQFRILSKLEPQDEHYAHAAEVLVRGYEGLYQRHVFGHLSEPVPERVLTEVEDIFQMFRGLTRAYEKGVKKPNGFHPEFDGFDGNNDPHHGVAHFLLHDIGHWEELKNRPTNSHSQANLPSYLNMVARWRKLGKPHPITQAQADEIVGTSS
jgi:uncharacterized protein YfbU (UPF0304 family)